MATFEAKKLELTQVNGGQEYEQGDFLQSDTINDVVGGTAYAQNVAEEANTKSDAAVSTANSANSTANAASEKVDTFEEDIATAQNTADTAVSNAATAQSTADSATTEINKIKNGTTVVPNANHANNADNANLATKAQQDVNGNPINTTYATVEYVDDLVTEKQGTRVTVNNVNVAELSFTSDPQTQITANKNAIAESQSDISDIVDGSQTVGKAAQDANGNVIDTTYAKLTQVVTKDNSTNSISATTDAAKYFLRNKQVLTGAVSIGATGWYRIAKLPTYSSSRITVTKQYNYGRGISLILDVAVGADNTEDATTNIVASYAGMKGQGNYIDKVRYKHAGSGQVYIDVHIISDGNQNSYWLAYDGTSAYTSAFTSSEFALYAFQQTSDTGGTELPMPEDTGLTTTGTIYQQGAPVFATDPTKLAPSTANGWTQTTTTGTLPGAGVYMIAFNHLPSQSTPWYYNPAILVYDGSSGSCIVTDSLSGAAIVSIVVKPSGIHMVDPVHITNDIESTNIYYKRIA